MGALVQGTNFEIADELCENHAHCSFPKIEHIIPGFLGESSTNFHTNFQTQVAANVF